MSLYNDSVLMEQHIKEDCKSCVALDILRMQKTLAALEAEYGEHRPDA